MIVSHEREKLIHAILYFCHHTKHCHTLKLFKLLNFLDFEHFRQSGRTVTGLKYYAFPMGPVPTELWSEMTDGVKPDLARALTVVTRRDSITRKVERRDLKPKMAFDKRLFTQREIRIMNRLALFFDDARGDDMSELAHMRGLPWRKVWADGKGDGREIPQDLSLSAEPLTHAATIAPQELEYRKDLAKGLR